MNDRNVHPWIRYGGPVLGAILAYWVITTMVGGFQTDLEATRRAALEEDAEGQLPETGAVVSSFIWKPVSERDGNLVVLIRPFAAEIIAGGVVLSNTGPSNGFSQTSRANRPGCAFGANVPVQAKDRQGRFLVWPNGDTTYTIPNGCNREEF